MKKLDLRNWQQAFNNGLFSLEDRDTQIDAGWYDWFCKDSSLRSKTNKMGQVLKQIKDGGKVNLDTTYVFFKNNCPLNGPLYDDFRICDIETGNVLFTVQFSCIWNDKKYAVFGVTPEGAAYWDKPLFETDSRKDLVRWLNSNWEVA